MIRDHYAYLLTGQAHLALVPGFALASLVLAFMALGTALRDVLDVRASSYDEAKKTPGVGPGSLVVF